MKRRQVTAVIRETLGEAVAADPADEAAMAEAYARAMAAGEAWLVTGEMLELAPVWAPITGPGEDE